MKPPGARQLEEHRFHHGSFDLVIISPETRFHHRFSVAFICQKRIFPYHLYQRIVVLEASGGRKWKSSVVSPIIHRWVSTLPSGG